MFNNELLTIPNPIMIVGENNSEGSQNISNQNVTQELLKNPQHPKSPSADIISDPSVEPEPHAEGS
jgi:hypothetical protein